MPPFPIMRMKMPCKRKNPMRRLNIMGYLSLIIFLSLVQFQESHCATELSTALSVHELLELPEISSNNRYVVTGLISSGEHDTYLKDIKCHEICDDVIGIDLENDIQDSVEINKILKNIINGNSKIVKMEVSIKLIRLQRHDYSHVYKISNVNLIRILH